MIKLSNSNSILTNLIKIKINNYSIYKNKFIIINKFSTSNSILARESLIDFYKVLKVNKTATKKEIKESFYEVSCN